MLMQEEDTAVMLRASHREADGEEESVVMCRMKEDEAELTEQTAEGRTGRAKDIEVW